MGMRVLGVVLMLGALVGCSSSGTKSSTSAPSLSLPATTAEPTSSTRPPITAPPTTAGPTTTTKPPATRGDFQGDWNVHGGQMSIPGDGAVTMHYSSAADHSDIVLSAEPSSDGKQLHLVVEGVTWRDANNLEIPDPDPADDFVVGDSFDLEVVRPGELNMVNIHTKNQVIGNTHWCGEGLDVAYVGDCGA